MNVRARVMTFGYNADLFLNPAAGRTSIVALDLLNALNSKRRGPEKVGDTKAKFFREKKTCWNSIRP
jgi:hypothetical protein